LGGVAIMSVIWNALVIGLLILVAAANIGYLVVFVLMLLAFVLLRRQRQRQRLWLGEPVVRSRPMDRGGCGRYGAVARRGQARVNHWGRRRQDRQEPR
jgi:hypothetical protein